MTDTFKLGQYRAIHLWGGPGTRRLLQLSSLKVDDKSFDMAHSIEGAERVAAMGFNWVFLAFSWGFPPEVEEMDWESFRSAVRHYHQVGVRVFGAIQLSNCVYQGSYLDKDWYALDPNGKKIFAYMGRYYTSLFHPEWQAEIRSRIRTLVETGVDGIYFDNPWMGGIGFDIAEMPVGPIGSYDEYTRSAYARAFDGIDIPLVLSTQDLAVQQYLNWRVTSTITILDRWIEIARNLNPDILIGINSFDAIVRNSYVSNGIDLSVMAEKQDIITVENFSWPRMQDDGSVVANAVTIGATQIHGADKSVTTKPQMNGFGLERMWLPYEIKRAIAEATAMNSPLVLQGTGFQYHSEVTLLLHNRYETQQNTIKVMLRWLETHYEWLANRRPDSPLAIYYPYGALRWCWNRIAPIFFAACETLLLNGFPLRIVGDEEWEGVKIILVPPGDIAGLEDRLQHFVTQGGKVITLGQKRSSVPATLLWEGWRPIRSRIPSVRRVRRYINQGANISWRLYHSSRMARWVAKRIKIPEAIVQSPLYFKPPQPFQQVLVEAIGRDFYPRVESEFPVLLTVWREADGEKQWHLVNYAKTPQQVTLHLDDLTATWVYVPGEDTPPKQVVGSSLILKVEVAKVVRSPV